MRKYGKLRSKLEYRVNQQLRLLGYSFAYEPYQLEYKVRVRTGECSDCGSAEVYQRRKYTPDFVLSGNLILEVKGRFTAADRAKMLAVRKDNPDYQFKMVFDRDNKLIKTKSARYSDWCKKHDYLYTFAPLNKPEQVMGGFTDD